MSNDDFDFNDFNPKDLTDDPKEVSHLCHFLQAAMQIELTTIPLYMTAMYSIHPGTNEEAQLVIRSVVLEEMLHLTLAANLVNALGGNPRLDQAHNLPSYPAKAPYSAESVTPFPLTPFSRAALDMFIAIESPPYGKPKWDTRGWHTIGQFYGLIDKGLRNLVKRHRERGVFTGDPDKQVGPEHFYNSGGEVIKVTDLRSAREAIEVIIEEGEGLDESIFTSDDRLFDEERQEAHYFRFKEIRYGRRYGVHDTPADNPSGAPMEVDWDSAYRFEVDPNDFDGSDPHMADAKALVERFTRTYAALTWVLHRTFNGDPARMKEAVPLMLDLRYLAEEIMRTPHPVKEGLNLYPNFNISPNLLTEVQK
ncbi:ferritin-like protein [Saccharopolyspora erythraea NRRL 2338]|uniref:Uncharacterized protein n=2 Tax=Saccharopolyspora erythraea TaxID=1836 RepID=A4FHP6_SACEN|nr:ferritin-like protein [Saccharopolyspora erythraea]EQD86821.1 ferritin [Saccharopolyspora erythraea D]PFG97259.1 ferritin-like protein [Saccharopolyspora erythraea NRRL 2338]QRK87454.1 ferritin-like protein [Saccharopolyspora erythraea]CAM03571.1 hypothetical protein SACE_4302 [Saccharopolyspora erythraea NRRL 2338]